MLFLLFSAAQAATLTGFAEVPGSSDDIDLPGLPACDDQFPFRLVQLPSNPGLYERWDSTRSWGTPALVDAIQGATARVAMRYPDADPVFIGDLSRIRGGDLPPHTTHFDGRSADIGLYLRGGAQPLNGFAMVTADELDYEPTWTLIDGLISTGRVRHILLDEALIGGLRSWLLSEDRLTEAEVERIFPSGPPSRSFPSNGIVRPAPNHRDHFHVRFRCE